MRHEVDRDSSVGIPNAYGLHGPGIESRWRTRFAALVQTGPGAYPASCTMGTGSFPGVKRAGRDVDPKASSAKFKSGIELSLYFHSGPSWFVLGQIFYERPEAVWGFNLSKPTGYVMDQQFNIQQLYALPTLYLCVLYLSENKQRLVPLTA